MPRDIQLDVARHGGVVDSWRASLGLPPRFSFLFPIFIAYLLLLAAATARAAADVHLAQYSGPITPVASEFILDGLDRAIDAGGGLFILQLDTPGGLDTDMREIIKGILSSSIPVVVYVGPGGSRAASAGAFITVAAHVAAMAPGTNIGSASPVAMMGARLDSTMTAKVTNDAAAYMASLAARRGRNVELARSFVVDAVNITAAEALADTLIDLIAGNLDELLSTLDGRVVQMGNEDVVLAARETDLIRHTMSVRLKFLQKLVDPNLAYLLFLLGIYGLFFELSNPGSLLPGILGGISILLAMYAFHALPVDYTGFALILLGAVLLIMEVKIPSYGVLTVGGLSALVLGSLMLFRSAEQWARVSLKVIIPSVLVFAGFFALCVALVVRGQKRRPVTGPQALVGEEGRVIERIDGGSAMGKAVIHGEIWDAVSASAIEPGTRVIVLEIKGRASRVEQVRGPQEGDDSEGD